ncbi:hypothetical protein SAMN05428976_10736 [Clostridium sp. USBA 49]|nr:hypothetical protein SAMN05428976_10736 [Clostridium sp. USBA 49]
MKNKLKNLSLVTLFSGLTAVSSNLKMMWMTGAMSTTAFVTNLAYTVYYALGGGNINSLKSAIQFVLGKGLNYSNWYDLAWTVIDAVLVFCPLGTASKVIISVLRLAPAF